ncbi:NUDIX hydrolase [Sphingobium aquiterrae]|uniref:NUDIX hydrolase n=1 Tax=Sphingobium aquiterrae TaxID=2038656 RepID=UPI0030191C1A
MTSPIRSVTTQYAGWSTMKLVEFALESGVYVKRHVEDHGLAVGVLPYDPDRRCALVISMLRAPVLLAGEPSIYEVPAGQREADGAEESARREALEEVGVSLRTLEKVIHAWSMPAISSERISLYLGVYSAADRIAPGGGRADEEEEITVAEVALDDLWTLYARGDLTDMKTAFLLQALRLRRPDLFTVALSG